MASDTPSKDAVPDERDKANNSPSMSVRMSALSKLSSSSMAAPANTTSTIQSSREESAAKYIESFSLRTQSKLSTLSSDDTEGQDTLIPTVSGYLGSAPNPSITLDHAAISSASSPMISSADWSVSSELEHELSLGLSLSSSRLLSHVTSSNLSVKSLKHHNSDPKESVKHKTADLVTGDASSSTSSSKFVSFDSEKVLNTDQEISSLTQLRTQQINRLRSPALQSLLREEGKLLQSSSNAPDSESSGASSASGLVKLARSAGSSPFPSSPKATTQSPPTTSPQASERMSSLVEKFDPRIDTNQLGSPEEKMMSILDPCVLSIRGDLKLSFQTIRENLAKKGVKNLAVITTTHFLSERVVDQYHESIRRMKSNLRNHDDFHVLVVGFGPEKFIPFFCSNLGIENVDVSDDQPLGDDYDNSRHISVVSDPQRSVYNIMTAYQVGKVTPVLPKGGIINSSTYSKSFRAFSKLTQPSTTGSGRQYLAWMAIDLAEIKMLHFEIDSETCKY